MDDTRCTVYIEIGGVTFSVQPSVAGEVLYLRESNVELRQRLSNAQAEITRLRQELDMSRALRDNLGNAWGQAIRTIRDGA